MMGQIVRKKKGRPPGKADPGARTKPPSESELRRSNRRRNVKYVFELDDYFDDDGLFEDEEDQLRREKKLKLLLKVESGVGGESTGPKPGRPGRRRVPHPRLHSSSSSSDVDQPCKKRRIDEGIDEENGDVSYDDNYNDDLVEVRERKSEIKAKSMVPAKQTGAASSGLSLPDKKTLGLILDTIQRKDIYGVFAEPVDPEELPDYHKVIKNPMDFGTLRSKLSSGLYATLEQVESDVMLICSNAMQYNAPNTIYYKQARAMHELAKRKFYELSLNSRSSEKESKSEQNLRSSPISNRQVKSPVNGNMQDPVGSDFSYRATHGAAADMQHVSNAFLSVGSSRPCSVDRLVERNSFLNDNNMDKADALLSGNNSLFKTGRKFSTHDDNRRATYDISLTNPLAGSESLFSTFEGESKQLIPVGAYTEHSYARSLARFASALGPVAWKISSKRIEQALSQEVKFGRGWVGEYEPLSTPVLILENCSVKEPPFFSKNLPDDARKLEKIPTVSISTKVAREASRFLEKNLHYAGPVKIGPAPVKAQPDGENVSEVKASFFLAPGSKPSTTANLNRASANLSHQHKRSECKNAVDSAKLGLKQVELNGPPIFNKNAVDFIGHRQISKSSEVEVSRSIFSSRNVNSTSSVSVKPPDIIEVAVGEFRNGKVGDRINSNAVASSSSNLAKGVGYHLQEQGHGLSDPVHLMKILAEKAQNQKKSLYQSSTDAPRVLAPTPNRDDLNNTVAATSHAWMPVGAGGFIPIVANSNPFRNQIRPNFLNISTRDMHSQVSRFCEESPVSASHFRPDRNSSPLNVFVRQGGPQHTRVGNDLQFQNQPMSFPSVPRANLRQISESHPPDLNVGFQSPGSPGKNPSSGSLVESQQPDLALQL